MWIIDVENGRRENSSRPLFLTLVGIWAGRDDCGTSSLWRIRQGRQPAGKTGILPLASLNREVIPAYQPESTRQNWTAARQCA